MINCIASSLSAVFKEAFLQIVIMLLELDNEKIKKYPFIILSTTYFIYFILFIKFSFYIFFFNKRLVMFINNVSYEFIKYNEDVFVIFDPVYF